MTDLVNILRTYADDGYPELSLQAADRIEALEAELREARMQSLADLGQAQEAYEAQKKAEAQLEKFRGYMVDIARDYINNCPESYIVFAQKKMEEMKDEG